MNAPYLIEPDDQGCGECLHGRTWRVMGPDGTAQPTSYDDQEDAQHLADALNEAFQAGAATGIPMTTLPWKRFTPETSLPEFEQVMVWDNQYQTPTSIMYHKISWAFEELQKFHFTHYLEKNCVPKPVDDPVAVQPELQAPEAPAITEPAAITDWTDDIPFAWAALIPLAGLMWHATKTLLQV